MIFDVAIVGGGPAGAACASFCAAAGQTTLLLERARFPRDKVCGDCLNPGCWPILDALGVSNRLMAMPHARLEFVTFVGIDGQSVRIPLPQSLPGEIAIKRRLLDHILLDRAIQLGVDVRQDAAVVALERGWHIHSTAASFRARVLVAADGRNSTVARLLGLLPNTNRDRVALQTIVPATNSEFAAGVTLRFLPHGYCGIAPVGNGEVNVCLVARPEAINAAKEWSRQYFRGAALESWHTVTPLTRRPVRATLEQLILVGDAARVVEPFTGEGIYYALASGRLAAHCIVARELSAYPRLQRELYHRRLWVNELARFASLHPSVATQMVHLAQRTPRILRDLIRRVMETGTLPQFTSAAPVSARK